MATGFIAMGFTEKQIDAFFTAASRNVGRPKAPHSVPATGVLPCIPLAAEHGDGQADLNRTISCARIRASLTDTPYDAISNKLNATGRGTGASPVPHRRLATSSTSKSSWTALAVNPVTASVALYSDGVI